MKKITLIIAFFAFVFPSFTLCAHQAKPTTKTKKEKKAVSKEDDLGIKAHDADENTAAGSKLPTDTKQAKTDGSSAKEKMVGRDDDGVKTKKSKTKSEKKAK